MEIKVAKELVHIRDWLDRAGSIVARGRVAYFNDPLLQEAGDSLMMKVGEAANRLARLGAVPPDGVTWAMAVANRNWLIHQYDEIDRNITWDTLSGDLIAWRRDMADLIEEAENVLGLNE